MKRASSLLLIAVLLLATTISGFAFSDITETTPGAKEIQALAEKEEQLTARLRGEDKELFQNYVSAYVEFSTTSNSDSFISGFRLGAKFTYDTFVKNPKG